MRWWFLPTSPSHERLPLTPQHLNIPNWASLSITTYWYIYICVCVCACALHTLFLANHVKSELINYQNSTYASSALCTSKLNTLMLLIIWAKTHSLGALGCKKKLYFDHQCLVWIYFWFSSWHKTIDTMRFQTHKYSNYDLWTWWSPYKLRICPYIETPRAFKG